MRTKRITTASLLFVLISCSDSFEGFAYPDRTNLTRSVRLGVFDTLEDCRIAARSRLAEMDATEVGDFECGKNCRSDTDLPGIRICEETLH